MRTLILNQSNVVSNSFNDTYTYRFPAGAVEFKDDQVAVTAVNIYYSWFNINQLVYNNNSFTYTWTNGITYPVTFPDGGYYTVADLNAYFQSVMFNNKHYLYNTTTGRILYFLELVENGIFYAIQYNAFVVPTVLPAGFALPAGATWALPVVASTPQITITNNNFGLLIGFTAGTYPPAVPQASTYSQTSPITPQLSPVSSLVMQCTLLNNRYANPSTLLYSFPPNTTFGSLITTQPAELVFVDIQEGQYTEFTITFRDQLLRTVDIKDANIVVMLAIRNKNEYTTKALDLKVNG
jgi:hypothetical protein